MEKIPSNGQPNNFLVPRGHLREFKKNNIHIRDERNFENKIIQENNNLFICSLSVYKDVQQN